MLKTQNDPPDHFTVTRLGIRKHKCEIRATVSLVHNKLRSTRIFLNKHFYNIQSIKGENVRLLLCIRTIDFVRLKCP